MLVSIQPKHLPVLTVLINSREDMPLSLQEIADAAGYTEQSARLHIRQLAAQGLIHVIRTGRGRGIRTIYQIAPEVYRLIK